MFRPNSPWLQERRRLVPSVRAHFAKDTAKHEEARVMAFWFAAMLFHTGTDSLIAAIKGDVTKLHHKIAAATAHMINNYMSQLFLLASLRLEYALVLTHEGGES